MAVYIGDETVLSQLLNKDQDMEEKDDSGRTVLAYAVRWGKSNIAALLICERGTCLNFHGCKP